MARVRRENLTLNFSPWTASPPSVRTSGAVDAGPCWSESAESATKGVDTGSTDEIVTLNHLTADGEAHMVSIARKKPTSRSATANALLLFSHSGTYSALVASRLQKGDALAVARIAGIQAAKKTADLIPLAHPGLDITGVTVRLEPFERNNVPYPLSEAFRQSTHMLPDIPKLHGGVLVTATVACEGKTGVEMEAITAASVAGLTMYDMLKGVDKCMVLTSTRVTAKSGGKSGDWEWDHKYHRRIITGKPGRDDKLGAIEAQQSITNTDTDHSSNSMTTASNETTTEPPPTSTKKVSRRPRRQTIQKNLRDTYQKHAQLGNHPAGTPLTRPERRNLRLAMYAARRISHLPRDTTLERQKSTLNHLRIQRNLQENLQHAPVTAFDMWLRHYRRWKMRRDAQHSRWNW
ncbi:hypothetical protein H2200_000018 [Cladophialophora chaetospira]|uniref:Molybdopterin cofactor biosynthesis C (MoaC) domain-containing protein n=1 Tax=Cladophialophora chaetospira TaxID=386627 RepID=A0AA39CPY0_9EURO|nr:hypothetical protein H2200_000018 [Cladophialophora chaetospira]